MSYVFRIKLALPIQQIKHLTHTHTRVKIMHLTLSQGKIHWKKSEP